MLRLLLLCAFSGAAAAAEFIGITAAVEGQVIRVSSTSGAPTGPIESGTQVFEGDVLSVSDGGRAQVMLKDQTTFTLGSGAEMKIDEFVFGTANDSLNANITKGAFRFVSGKIAKTGPDAMTVDLPSAVIGVRGTQVAGLLDENGEGDVVLIGPGPNSFGVTPGAITVANDFGTQDVLRGGFAVGISPNTAPTAPVPAPAELLERVEQAVQELAGEEIAEEVATELADPQTVALLEALVEAGVEGPDDATNSVDVLAVVLGSETAEEVAGYGIGFTGEALYLLSQYEGEIGDNPPPGPTLSELTNAGLVGSYRYSASNVNMTVVDNNGDPVASDNAGSFNSTTTVNFDTDTLRSVIDGRVERIDLSANNSASFDFDFDQSAPLSRLLDGQNGVAFVAQGQDQDLSDNDFTLAPMPAPPVDLSSSNPNEHTTQAMVNDATNSFFTDTNSNGILDTGEGPAQTMVISNFSSDSTPLATESLMGSLSGSFVNLNGDTGVLGVVNVTFETVENNTTITNLGGTGVSVRTPE